jgi:hypothetical protein
MTEQTDPRHGLQEGLDRRRQRRRPPEEPITRTSRRNPRHSGLGMALADNCQRQLWVSPGSGLIVGHAAAGKASVTKGEHSAVTGH